MASIYDKQSINIDFDILENVEVYDNEYALERIALEDVFAPSDDVIISRSPTLAASLPVNKLKSNFSSDGYEMIRGYKNLVKQNFKNLMLTSPGEKMMDPAFGVGLRRFLFELSTNAMPTKIEGRILSQTSKYLSYVTINSIELNENESLNSQNALKIKIVYFINPLNLEAVFNYPSAKREELGLGDGGRL